uniref:Uncharacterized protein n=1 Tax=Pyropia fucicola TaxID=144551 RepID=A0A059XLV8_9RHOD|nr:hypothetical protein [Neopyropia fucicola]
MATFELIPYRLYLSQSNTWMHRIKAEIKIYIITLLWISIFIFSYFKLCIIALSLIAISFTIRSKQNIIQKHLLQTLLMTFLTTILSFSVATSYKQYAEQEQSQYLSDSKKYKNSSRYYYIQIANDHRIKRQYLITTLKPALYFFITIYSIKLVMITTSPEVLVITIYRSRMINKIFKNELLFLFLLSLHIVTSIINRLEKVMQVTSSRGSLNLRNSFTRLLIFSLLIFQVFFLEIIRDSKEIAQALYTRNLNQENNNFLKVYTVKSHFSDRLNIIISTLYFIILALA